MGRHAHRLELHTHCTGMGGEMQMQTGSAAEAKAVKLAGAQHAVSTLMVKGAKKINNSPTNLNQKGKKGGRKK